MVQHIVYASTDALGEGRDGMEGGDELAELRAVEDYTDGLVAQQVCFVAPGLGGCCTEAVGGYMAGFQLYAQGLGNGLVDLVP